MKGDVRELLAQLDGRGTFREPLGGGGTFKPGSILHDVCAAAGWVMAVTDEKGNHIFRPGMQLAVDMAVGNRWYRIPILAHFVPVLDDWWQAAIRRKSPAIPKTHDIYSARRAAVWAYEDLVKAWDVGPHHPTRKRERRPGMTFIERARVLGITNQAWHRQYRGLYGQVHNWMVAAEQEAVTALGRFLR